MDKNYENDFWLSSELRAGNGKAFEYLMDCYYPVLCTYAYTLTHDHANAEDIVQSVFVSIWEKRKKINPGLSIKNYIYKSVYNEFINQYRKNKPVVYLEKKYIEAIDIIVENNHEELERLMHLVDNEIEMLPPKCKRIFLLNKKDGLTHTEISEHLNVSIKTVEGHITRAFKILAEKLGSKTNPVLFLLFDFGNQLKRLN
ncbi:RNA polymerase sigma factor [Aurantibacter crassamenti]|uniref:RNA polymerase sigma factor n=1 Tax=Aurantibacter crassamenti TaxID=1837375 RepID=UPI001EED6841|nr:RNA polymerase sigma-70 factor [Aurantibacter crassamenti]